jgi:hypothetical protein
MRHAFAKVVLMLCPAQSLTPPEALDRQFHGTTGVFDQ